jgi:quinol monooxygenase YgiN
VRAGHAQSEKHLLQSGLAPNVFYIVDAFANDGDRSKHLSGEIAKALMAKTDVLGVKL